jgi:hypothetical protein
MSVGGSYLFSKEINEDFNWGVCMNMRTRFELKSRKISFVPQIRYRSYSMRLEEDYEVRNVMSVTNLGLQLDIKLFQSLNSDFSVSNKIEFNHAWIYNRFAWEVTDQYTPTQSSTNTETFDIFKGTSFSMLVGYSIRYKIFYLEMGYDILDTKVQLSKELIQEYQNNDIEFDPEPKFNFNSLNITAGVSIPFKYLTRNRLLW